VSRKLVKLRIIKDGLCVQDGTLEKVDQLAVEFHLAPFHKPPTRSLITVVLADQNKKMFKYFDRH
jgi:hypothetical protein